jgi:hypothetical protein
MVKCSVPDCDKEASAKVAAPWTFGRFAELKTYGYACPAHTDEVVEKAEVRSKPPHLAEGETLGQVGIYDL